jgi:superfamily II helicase
MFTQENCSSGHSERGIWIVMPAVCATCKKKGCDDCVTEWKVCQYCDDGICDECTVTALSRRIVARAVKTQYMCAPCAALQKKVRARLIADLDFDPDDAGWLEPLIEEAEQAIGRARKAANL